MPDYKGRSEFKYLCSAFDVLGVAGDKAGLVLVVGGHFIMCLCGMAGKRLGL
jgi:hypothetical protein